MLQYCTLQNLCFNMLCILYTCDTKVGTYKVVCACGVLVCTFIWVIMFTCPVELKCVTNIATYVAICVCQTQPKDSRCNILQVKIMMRNVFHVVCATPACNRMTATSLVTLGTCDLLQCYNTGLQQHFPCTKCNKVGWPVAAQRKFVTV